MTVEEKRTDEEKTTVGVSAANKSPGDFRLQQLDIGSVENALYRQKWWQIWYILPKTFFLMALTHYFQASERPSTAS